LDHFYISQQTKIGEMLDSKIGIIQTSELTKE